MENFENAYTTYVFLIVDLPEKYDMAENLHGLQYRNFKVSV